MANIIKVSLFDCSFGLLWGKGYVISCTSWLNLYLNDVGSLLQPNTLCTVVGYE